VTDRPRPTIRDVAARAGVSVATVSRVMNEKEDVSDDALGKLAADHVIELAQDPRIADVRRPPAG
jgi:transcriptional regulator with XRE-family HTH domain